ncbi:MAG: hypothetical protein ACYCW6_22900 [Candidatus Xenobia bacterium]
MTNLDALIEAVTELENGSSTPDLYHQRIGRVRMTTELGVNLFKTEVVQSGLERLPPEQREMAQQTAAQIAVFFESCTQMQAWRPGDPLDPVKTALDQARAACAVLFDMQQRAIVIAEHEGSI